MNKVCRVSVVLPFFSNNRRAGASYTRVMTNSLIPGSAPSSWLADPVRRTCQVILAGPATALIGFTT